MVMSFKTITVDDFKKRLIDLCLRSGLAGFPKRQRDQHILFKSVTLIMKNYLNLTEKEVNDKLEYWLKNICEIKYFDYITLRRWLVDTGYLNRTKDGASYQVSKSEAQEYLFDDKIDQINIIEVLEKGREEIARRKRQYQNSK